MKNKKTYILGIAIASVLISVVFWIIRSEGSGTNGIMNSTVVEAEENRPAPRDLQSIDERKKAFSKRIAQEEAAMIKRVNVDIQFWGKVVDQNGKPLEGVRIKYRIGKPRHAWDSHTVVKNTISDVNGLFQIQDTGDGFSFEEFQKESFLQAKGTDMSFTYSSTSEKFIPDKANPKTYVLIPESEMPGLVASEGRIVSQWDGTPIFYNLKSGKFDGTGKIKFTTKRGEAKPNGKYDWSCRIEVTDGGVLQTSRENSYIAPEDGYKPFWECGFISSDPEWAIAKQNIHLFFKLPDGTFGRIQFDIDAEFGSRVCGLIYSFWNPSGGRLLEYDARRKIK